MRVIVVGTLVQREFEDRDGNKRSMIEVQMSHVGPDLQFVPVGVGPSAATLAEEKSRAQMLVVLPALSAGV